MPPDLGKEGNSGNEGAPNVLGHTGHTGGPGLPGGSCEQDQSFADMVKQASYESFVGATGGIGGVPESAEEVRKSYKYEDLLATLKTEVPKIVDEDKLIEKVNEACVEYDALFEKTNAMVAAKAYAAGMYLNQLQFIRKMRKKRDWSIYSQQTFPNLKKTPRENRMNIAALPGVENHFTLGVERLAEFARLYQGKTEKEQKLLGGDPITSILKKYEVDLSLPIEENRVKIDAVLAHYELDKKEVVIDPAVIERFFLAGHKITAADRKHMVAIAKKDKEAPAKYLTEVIAAGGDREGMLKGIAPDAEYVNTKINNIDLQIGKLDETLQAVFKTGKIEGRVDYDKIDALIKRLEKFRSTLRSY